MQKILVMMMTFALTIAAQAQQYDGINTYTYDYGLSGRTMMLRATLDFNNAVKFLAEPSGEAERNKVIFVQDL